jgi:hypothetical protein
MQEMDECFCSKQYNNVRQWAHLIRGHTNDIVKYYAVKTKSKGSPLHGTLKKVLQAVCYINNTECTSLPTQSSETMDQSLPSFVCDGPGGLGCILQRNSLGELAARYEVQLVLRKEHAGAEEGHHQ